MKRVLFICTGNICRSPIAEAILRQKAKGHPAHPTAKDWVIDSAGTGDWHRGESPDSRAVQAAEKRGYDCSGIFSRPIEPSDFDNFDLIYCMTDSHVKHLTAMSDSVHHSKIKLLLDIPNCKIKEVPDPYYGGIDGFERMMDLLEHGCDALLEIEG